MTTGEMQTMCIKYINKVQPQLKIFLFEPWIEKILKCSRQNEMENYYHCYKNIIYTLNVTKQRKLEK